ncbi:glycosyltransferase family 2 protein [Desulfovermiculus halophilus]|uniref:glycosyltransferase family 2 protein n=1 Tax=Desulfovermiculus halophilus TaxID=339722 RepID=UPI0009FE618C|nr:glycosyltransferase family 2 protein [Desulfovermiculus halophilus]
MNTYPFVSIIIPCYNEEKYIGQCLDSILAGDYPFDYLEILVVDGGSADKTREIVSQYSKIHQIVKLTDNPHRLKPHALNIGIDSAQGDIVIRMDAHSNYDAGYVSKSVSYLNKYNADNVGGIRQTLPGSNSVIGKSIAISISHPFAAGNAIYRTGAKDIKWVDTVFGGCYRRQIFQDIGLFDEALVRGQDREFNIRLQKAGGKILFAPDIICHYFARGTLRGYIPWIFSAGLTPFFVSRMISKKIFSWRNLVPLAFVLSLMILSLLSFFHPFFQWLLGIELAIYIFCSLAASIPIAHKERDWRFVFSMPFIFFLTHFLYGMGSLVGLIKPIKNPGEWTKA